MTSVLLLVDVQKDMLEPPEPVPDAAPVGEAIKDLLGRARSAAVPVIHIRNTGGPGDPDAPGTPGWELVHQVAPGEQVIDKDECDAFAGTRLAELVPASATITVAGMQSEFCIRETSLSALRRGHPVILVRGAHATYDGEIPARGTSAAIEAELSEAGVSVLSPAALPF
jgi:nicotinamidase-related amidase